MNRKCQQHNAEISVCLFAAVQCILTYSHDLKMNEKKKQQQTR